MVSTQVPILLRGQRLEWTKLQDDMAKELAHGEHLGGGLKRMTVTGDVYQWMATECARMGCQMLLSARQLLCGGSSDTNWQQHSEW